MANTRDVNRCPAAPPLDSGKRFPDVGSMFSDPSSAIFKGRPVVAIAAPLLSGQRVQMPDCYT